MLLENRIAVVTGGASGIGRSIALAFAREGARVVVSDLDEAGGQETLDLVARQRPGAATLFVRADAASAEDHERLVRLASDRASCVTGAHYAVDGGYLAR